MWSSKRIWNKAMLLALLSAPLAAIAGCTITPVYSDATLAQSRLRFSYGEPTNRLEQIVYQDLSLRFGGDAGPNAPVLHVAVRSAARDLTLTKTNNPVDASQATVTGTVTVVSADGTQLLLSASRNAQADYEVNGQVFADHEALLDAQERGAHALAESLRLALLAKFAAR